MSASIEQTLRDNLVVSLDVARQAVGIGRGLAYRLANDDGELMTGVPIRRVGGNLVVPTRPLLAALGLDVWPVDPAAADRKAAELVSALRGTP